MNNENKLPEDFKAKWVAALRSGEYKKCTGVIRTLDNSFCCLGVAGMVYTNGNLRKEDGYDKLPEAIAGGYNNPIASRLIEMNDGEEKSFSEIADYIEANL